MTIFKKADKKKTNFLLASQILQASQCNKEQKSSNLPIKFESFLHLAGVVLQQYGFHTCFLFFWKKLNKKSAILALQTWPPSLTQG